MLSCDIVIRGGLVVNADGASVQDVAIRGEKVAQVGGRMSGAREIQADGMLVLPGGVDVHVHLSPARAAAAESLHHWVDDFFSGSQAAIAGGITTFGNMTFQWAGESLHEALERDLVQASKQSAVDFILHPVLTDPRPSVLNEIPDLAKKGFKSIKVFLSNPSFDAAIADFIKAIRLAGRHDVLVMMHCEDQAILRAVADQLEERGMNDVRRWADSRPDYAEEIAVRRAAAICRATSASVYVVHVSSAAALSACAAAKLNGLPFHVEARPMYLHLTRAELDSPDGGKYIGAPPLRELTDVSALWEGLVDGTVDTWATDHAPWSLEAKLESGLNLQSARQGVADLETSLPLLFTAGVTTGRISMTRFVELVSTAPAKLFGLWPKKGVIAPGSDADIVLWDPDRKYTVDGSSMYSRAGYSVYDGREVTGSPTMTISRGTVVMESGRVSALPGRGVWLPVAHRPSPSATMVQDA